MQRLDKAMEATYLEDVQAKGYEHLGEPLQIEFNKGIDEIRNWVLVQAQNLNADLIIEVENPPAGPGHSAILVYYIWKIPKVQVPQAEPQAFACPYCTQPFMAIPGPQDQVVACPSCGGANIIPAVSIPEQPAASAAPAAAPLTPAAHETEPSAQPSPPTTATEQPTIEEPKPVEEKEPTPAAEVAQAPQTEIQGQAQAPPAPVAQVATQKPTTPDITVDTTETQVTTETDIEDKEGTTTTTTQAPSATTAPPAAPAPAAAAVSDTTSITEEGSVEQDEYQQSQYRATQSYEQEYSTEMPSFDYFTKKIESDTNKPKAPLLTPEYEQAYTQSFTSIEQAIKLNMEKLANLLANPKNTIKFYDSGELMYPKITIRKSAYTHLGTREMDLLLIKDGVNDYKIIANESHGTTGGTITPMQDELFAIKTLGHSSYRAMEDWAYLDNEQKIAVSKCVFAFTDIYIKKIPKEVETQQ
jgi:hypothetical protein